MAPPGPDTAAVSAPLTAPGLKLAVLRATAEQATGATTVVAGLTVVERALRQLRRMGYRITVATDGTVALPSSAVAFDVRTVSDGDAVPALARELGGAATVDADVVRPANRDLVGGVRVTDETSRKQAEDAIFGELLRGDLGLVARHFNKPLSFRITRYLLCRLPVTPNQVTLAAGAIGVLGASLIASGRPAWGVLGLLLAHVQSVLDGCDGELARVRFQQSAIGEWLDTIIDDGLNLVIIAALGIGVARMQGSVVPLVMGIAACALLFTYNVVAYRELIRQGEGGEVLKVRWWFARGVDLKQIAGGRTGLLRWLLTIGRRDFFVLAWVVLGLLGLWKMILLYALVIAAVNGSVGIGQLLSGHRRRNHP